MKKLAIIGAGISGLSAAYYLRDHYEITLFEKQPRIGGNSRTIEISTKEVSTKVDTGFIVMNDRNYPNLTKLFEELGIDLHPTEMSFSLSSEKYEWSGNNLDTLFAQRKNLVDLRFLKGLLDILKFNRKAKSFIEKHPEGTLSELLDALKIKSWFRDYYLYPMGAAIWSSTTKGIEEFPAKSFVIFFDNHGLLTINNRPNWMSLTEKSISYVSKLEKILEMNHTILKGVEIQSITREQNKVLIQEKTKTHELDAVLFSNHPEEILKVLKDPSGEEKNILSKFSQSKNIAYTHNDLRFMPKRKKCWASWNFQYNMDSKEGSITYWMNKLQRIREDFPLLVTLNPIFKLDPKKVYDTFTFYHPVYNLESFVGQNEISMIQGKDNLYYCGAYLKNGFHEDGIASALDACHVLRK